MICNYDTECILTTLNDLYRIYDTLNDLYYVELFALLLSDLNGSLKLLPRKYLQQDFLGYFCPMKIPAMNIAPQGDPIVKIPLVKIAPHQIKKQTIFNI